jgi:hypothetical protein
MMSANSHASVRIAVDLRYGNERNRDTKNMKITESNQLTNEEKFLASILLISLANAHNVALTAREVRDKHKDEQIAMALEMTAAHAYGSARDVIAMAPEKVRKVVEERFDAAMKELEPLKAEPPERLH